MCMIETNYHIRNLQQINITQVSFQLIHQQLGNDQLTSHAFKNLTTKRKKLTLWIIIEFNNTRSNITFDLHSTLQHNHNKKNSKHIKMQSIMEKKS
jgi:hypothetical protein